MSKTEAMINKKQWEVYQMPKKLGGDWAFTGGGIISDGYKTQQDAYDALIEAILLSQKQQVEELKETPNGFIRKEQVINLIEKLNNS